MAAGLRGPGSAVSSGFFFNDTATTEIYTLSLHDALPILQRILNGPEEDRYLSPYDGHLSKLVVQAVDDVYDCQDRKSTRLNSSHSQISYAVFCLTNK